MNEQEQTAGLAATPGYRYAEEVGGRLYLAGQVPHDATGTLVAPGDPHRQAARCLENLVTVLTVHDFEIGEVRRMTIHVVGSREDLASAWQAVSTFFGDDVPPATLLGVPVLGHHGQLVEIDAEVCRAP